MKRKAPPDCRKCGACCVSQYDQDVFCDVDEKDIARLSPRLVRKHVKTSSMFDVFVSGDSDAAFRATWREQRAGALKGCRLCACVFLRGSVLHRTSCRIYDKRPDICRKAFKPGDRACLDTRRTFEQYQQEC